jgi:hypothetical protein
LQNVYHYQFLTNFYSWQKDLSRKLYFFRRRSIAFLKTHSFAKDCKMHIQKRSSKTLREREREGEREREIKREGRERGREREGKRERERKRKS